MHSGCFCYRSNNVWFWKEQGLVSFAEMKCQKCKHFGAHNTPLPIYNVNLNSTSQRGPNTWLLRGGSLQILMQSLMHFGQFLVLEETAFVDLDGFGLRQEARRIDHGRLALFELGTPTRVRRKDIACGRGICPGITLVAERHFHPFSYALNMHWIVISTSCHFAWAWCMAVTLRVAKPGAPWLVQRIGPVLVGCDTEAVPLATRNASRRSHQNGTNTSHTGAISVFPGSQQTIRCTAHVFQGHLLQQLHGSHDGQSTSAWWINCNQRLYHTLLLLSVAICYYLLLYKPKFS